MSDSIYPSIPVRLIEETKLVNFFVKSNEYKTSLLVLCHDEKKSNVN